MQVYMKGARVAPGAPMMRRVRTWSSLLVLAASIAACSDSSTGPNTDTPSTLVPDELAGEWVYGTISPTNFWDDHTGQYVGNAYGIGVILDLEPNGRYSQMVYIYTQAYSCRTQVWTHMEGTVTVNGSALTFYPHKGNYKAADTCIAKNNFQRAMTKQEIEDKQGETWAWQLDYSSGQEKLFTGPGGPSEFRRFD